MNLDLKKLIIFDLDGTLVNSDLTVLNIINSMRKKRNLQSINLCEAKDGLLMGGEGLINDLIGNYDVKKTLNEFRENYLNCNLDKENLFPYVLESLKLLKSKNIKLAVCTNKPRALVDKVLNHHKINFFFDIVITGCDVKKKKPDPEGLIKIFNFFKLNVNDVLYIGDSEIDFQASKRANVNFVLFNPNKENSEHLNFDSYLNFFKC